MTELVLVPVTQSFPALSAQSRAAAGTRGAKLSPCRTAVTCVASSTRPRMRHEFLHGNLRQGLCLSWEVDLAEASTSDGTQ